MDDVMRRYVELERAMRAGDLATVQSLYADADFPDICDTYTGTPLLALAISWAPLATVQQLLSAGATVDYPAQDGFPSLIAAILSGRPDSLALTRLLLEAGADLTQRGLNDWTPLHAATSLDDPELVALLLSFGADPEARTTIDGYATALEEAVQLGKLQAADVLRVERQLDG